MDYAADLERLKRPMTDEEQRRALEAIEQAIALSQRIFEERGRRPFPPAEQDLAELRADREAQLP
jgi:hypothetical protein